MECEEVDYDGGTVYRTGVMAHHETGELLVGLQMKNSAGEIVTLIVDTDGAESIIDDIRKAVALVRARAKA